MPLSPASPDSARNGLAAEVAGWPPALRAVLALLASPARQPPPLDEAGWDAFVTLVVGRHRVAPAVLDGARRLGCHLPARVERALAAEARRNAAMALVQKAETVRLLQALGRDGCRPVVMKGWPLAEQLYGAAGQRHASDIDLYVAPDEVDAVFGRLAEIGYHVDPVHQARVACAGEAAFRSEYNDMCFVSESSGVTLEVHWRNYHFRGWPELRDLPGAFEELEVDRTGERVRVLSPEANLVYLAMHGQQHLWARLKWLLDIARLAEARGGRLIDDLAFARAAGAARPVALGVRLAHLVFGSPLPADWPRAGAGERRALRRFCRLIASEGGTPGALEAKLQYYRTAFGLAETVPQRIGVVRYLLWRRMRLGWLRGQGAPT